MSWLSRYERHAAVRFEEWCQTPLTNQLRRNLLQMVEDGECPLLAVQDDGREQWGVSLPDLNPFVLVTRGKGRKRRMVTVLPPGWG